MGNRGDMTELELFKVAEELKDRYTYFFKKQPDIGLSRKAIEDSAPLMARILNNFNARVEEDGPRAGFSYLLDTIGYYVMLCSDMNDTNLEMVKLLEEAYSRLDEE